MEILNDHTADVDQIAVSHASESETVNPTAPCRLASPYLEMPSGKKRHIDSLFARYLISRADRARKTIIRTLRARDVTKDEYMGSKRPDEDEEGRDEAGVIKSGDLGTFLVSLRENRTVCLAVGQVLNFRKGKSNQNLWRMHMDDLDSELLAAATVAIAIQVIDLGTLHRIGEDQRRSGNGLWTTDYIQIQERSTGILTASSSSFFSSDPWQKFHALSHYPSSHPGQSGRLHTII